MVAIRSGSPQAEYFAPMMIDEREWMAVLKEVSRSFYLSLRLLPSPMRRGAALAYLMARASDTVADTSGVPLDQRMADLTALDELVSGKAADLPDFSVYRGVIGYAGEAVLMERLGDVWDLCMALPDGEQSLVGEVLTTIISGQQMDLRRFTGALADQPIALASAEELDDYTYRVAGCVGEFWTKLGYETLGERFSSAAPDTLCAWGREYGMGLQLVNILRDLPEDLRMGRCYLPVADPLDAKALLDSHQSWVEIAIQKVSSGFSYAEKLGMRRLRLASRLPAEIAMETLIRMRGVSWDLLAHRVKVPRRMVYAAMIRGWLTG